ncbi:MAG TPA: ATP-binding cassette domain-containing protein, partial [Anaeromyxobacter sp.]
GKSTLLRLIAGLDPVSAGTVAIGDKDMTARQAGERPVAMVFQSYALYPHMSVYENMAFGLKLAKTGKQEVDRRVREAARVLQIEHLLARKPRELSGGQRQRVAIGRAITRDPRLFLFDEPLSNLDAALRVQMRIEIARLKDAVDATMIYVTHDQVEAMTLADRIVVLNAGRVEQVGDPLELYEHPRNVFVAGFIGSPKMNLLAATVDSVRPGAVAVRLSGGAGLTVPVEAAPPGLAQGAKVTLGVRPTDVLPSGQGEVTVKGRVLVVERLGAESFLYLRIEGDETLVARSEPTLRTSLDELVAVALNGSRCHLFGADDAAVPRRRPEPRPSPGASPPAGASPARPV